MKKKQPHPAHTSAKEGQKPAYKSSVSQPKGKRQRPEKKGLPLPKGGKSAPLTPQKALQKRGVLLWGLHAVAEAWLNPKRSCLQLWVTPAGLALLTPILQQSEKQHLKRPPIVEVQKADIDRLLPPGSVHQGIALDTQPLQEVSLDDLLGKVEKDDIVVVLDQVTDPHNVGAILRSAAALGASALIVTERGAPATTGLMAKTACGAAEHVPVVPVVNLSRALEALKQESFWCIGLAEEGEKPLSSSKLAEGRLALVLGAEGDGLRRLTRQHCDDLAHLPTQGSIRSLNVSNAAAIALYEIRRQRTKL